MSLTREQIEADPAFQAYLARSLAGAPPLSQSQIDYLARILASATPRRPATKKAAA